jgi:hypothetical protein
MTRLKWRRTYAHKLAFLGLVHCLRRNFNGLASLFRLASRPKLASRNRLASRLSLVAWTSRLPWQMTTVMISIGHHIRVAITSWSCDMLSCQRVVHARVYIFSFKSGARPSSYCVGTVTMKLVRVFQSYRPWFIVGNMSHVPIWDGFQTVRCTSWQLLAFPQSTRAFDPAPCSYFASSACAFLIHTPDHHAPLENNFVTTVGMPATCVVISPSTNRGPDQ